MSEIIDQAIALFENYRTVWGKTLYLDGDLNTPKDQTVKAVKEPAPFKDLIQASAQHIQKQRSPELQSYFMEIKDCKKCALGSTRKNFVFGYGNPQAELMLIGEAPGRDEDEQGIPFVGRAGQLLDKMLHAIGLNRDSIFIANILKCRPPQNRDPLPDEIVKCEPYLHKQLDIIRPKILLALGRVSGQNLIKQEASLSAMRNQDYNYNSTPLIVTYHPAALLRNPRWKENSWQDLKKVKKILDVQAGVDES